MRLRLTFEKKLQTALAAAVAMVLVLTVFAWNTWHDADQASRLVAHTVATLGEIAPAREATVVIESLTPPQPRPL